MAEGSRWYFPVYEGLFDAKHVTQMGQSIWLYGWVLARAFAAQRDGILAYTHRDAAMELGVTDRTARLWFDRLQENGYLITRARHPYHLEVEVTNWRSVEEWIKARPETIGAGVRTVKSYHSEVEIGNENGNENGKKLPLLHISISLSDYHYPSGAEAPAGASLADAFRDLLEHLKTAPNKAAILAQIYRLCFGDTDVPDYGYLGKAAKVVGGAGRLAELMWQATTKPPTGDVLAYLMAQAKASRPGNGKCTVETSVDVWTREAERITGRGQ